MSWNPIEEDNITIFRISFEQLWIPDLFLYHGACLNWNLWSSDS
jgi:hypothetical protein